MHISTSYFSRYFLYKLAKHKILFFVSLILNALALPLMSFTLSASIDGLGALLINSTEESRKTYEYINEFERLVSNSVSSLTVCIVVFAVLVILSVVTPTLVFSYNHRKAESDMYLSLPITSNGRFFADTLVGAVICILPLAINLIGGFAFIGKGADVISANPQLLYADCISSVSTITVGYPYELLCFSATIGVTTVIGCFFSSLFFSGSTGKTAQSIIFSFAGPVILQLLSVEVTALILCRANGIIEWQSVKFIPCHIAPFGTVYTGFLQFFEAIEKGADIKNILHIPLSVILSFAAISLLFFIGAYLAAKKRKAENAGDSFAIEAVYKVTLTAFITLVTAFLSFLVLNPDGNANPRTVIIRLVITFGVYVFVQFFHYKSFRNILKWTVHFFATVALSFGVFALIAFSKGLGYANFVPSPDDVEYVEVSSYITGYYRFHDNESKIVYSKAEDIMLVGNIHKKIAESDTPTGYDVKLTYKMKNGKAFERCYSYPSAELSQESRDALLSSATTIDFMLCEAENYEAIGSFLLKDDGIKANNLSLLGVNKLNKAIRLDFENGSLSSGAAIGVVNIHWTENYDYCTGYIIVKENCENIISVLNDESNYSPSLSGFYEHPDTIEEPNRIIAIVGENYSNLLDLNYKEDNLFIRNKDLNNEKVKQLLELIEFAGAERTDSGYWMCFDTVNGSSACFSEENSKRVQTLIEEIKAEREAAGDVVQSTDLYGDLIRRH